MTSREPKIGGQPEGGRSGKTMIKGVTRRRRDVEELRAGIGRRREGAITVGNDRCQEIRGVKRER
eukprot:6353780-Pyramimonas_sp.AAC.1